jgi:hypothetical protein
MALGDVVLKARYLGAVAPRARVLAFGSAAALVVAGSICAALVGGQTGDVLAIGLITLGLGAALLLMFLEVGLSEERELAREEKRRQERATDGKRRLRPRRWPRRPV